MTIKTRFGIGDAVTYTQLDGTRSGVVRAVFTTTREEHGKIVTDESYFIVDTATEEGIEINGRYVKRSYAGPINK